MHVPLFPPRRQPGAQYGISEQVQDAIQRHWTSLSSSDDSPEPDTPPRERPTQYFQPRKPTFKALGRSSATEQSPSRNIARNSLDGQKSMLRAEQPTGTRSTTYSCVNRENIAQGSRQVLLNRPTTPRPKTRSTLYNLPLRALTARSASTGSDLQIRREVGSEHNLQCMDRNQADPSDHDSVIRKDLNAMAIPGGTADIGPEDFLPTVQCTDHITPAKANSGLKLRSPAAANLQSSYVPSSKKRRNTSIYDMNIDDDEGVEDASNEPKRLRTLWNTASEAFGKRPANDKHQGTFCDVELALVPRTPSPTRGKSSFYLPRL